MRNEAGLPKDHDCIEEGRTSTQHYGDSSEGTCLVCGGCFDWQCCSHDEDCKSPKEKREYAE